MGEELAARCLEFALRVQYAAFLGWAVVVKQAFEPRACLALTSVAVLRLSFTARGGDGDVLRGGAGRVQDPPRLLLVPLFRPERARVRGRIGFWGSNRKQVDAIRGPLRAPGLTDGTHFRGSRRQEVRHLKNGPLVTGQRDVRLAAAT